MTSDKLGMIPTQQVHKSLSSHPHAQLVFPEALAYVPPLHHGSASAAVEQGPKTTSRDLTSGFLDHHPRFFHTPQPQASEFRPQWAANSRESARNASGDVDEEEEDYDGDEEEEGNNLQNVVTVAKIGGRNQDGRYSPSDDSRKMKHISGLGIKQGNVGQGGNNENHNAGEVTNTGGGGMYYTPYLNGEEAPSSSSGQKDIVDLENGCGFSGRKDNIYLSESGESLRVILADPLTGTLMDDAMILPCGHSFGSDGIEQILRVKACCTCSKPVSEDAIAPNLSLRLAVQAFRREEELLVGRPLKRKRESYDRDVVTYGQSMLPDHRRGNGIQFPFAITDRVIIKGNKRTPLRFVGREAIVTAQCLNGWYVVKTLDNAESVKLQYRSLAKVADNPASNPLPTKMIPNWL